MPKISKLYAEQVHTKQTTKVSDYTDSDLIKDYKATYQAVEVDECFNLSDMARLEHEEVELARRGYKIIKSVKVMHPDGIGFFDFIKGTV